MSRVFVGVAHGATDTSDVYVEQNGRRQRLTRRVRGAQEGYRWDKAGPHSTELARAMLWVVTGAELPWTFYRGFASDVLANLPMPPCEGDCWRLSEAEIRAWLNGAGWAIANIESEHPALVVEDEQLVRPRQMAARHLAGLFRSRVAAGRVPHEITNVEADT